MVATEKNTPNKNMAWRTVILHVAREALDSRFRGNDKKGWREWQIPYHLPLYYLPLTIGKNSLPFTLSFWLVMKIDNKFGDNAGHDDLKSDDA